MSKKEANVSIPFQQQFNKIIAQKLPQALPGMLDSLSRTVCL